MAGYDEQFIANPLAINVLLHILIANPLAINLLLHILVANPFAISRKTTHNSLPS